MEIKIRYWIVLLALLTVQLSSMNIHSQIAQQKPSRQVALDAYSKGDYEKAYKEFNILSEFYSKDPLYKYYLGVCLVKMNRYPENAGAFLQDALNGSLDIKSIPDDALFFLGRSQQMAGKFAEAIRSFNSFADKAGKKRAREYNVSGYIQECNEGRGRVKDTEDQLANIISKAEKVNTDAGQKVTTDKNINQPVAKPVPQKKNLPDEYDKVLSEAMEYQVKADSLNTLVSEYKKEFGRLPPSQQQAAKSRISEMESLASEYQKLADEKFSNTGTKARAQQDVAAQISEPDVKKSVEVYSLFNNETNPELLKDQKISIDPELPEGLIYRIQIGVFSKSPDPSFTKGISPVSGFRIPGTESTRYFAGMFRRMADANRALLTMKQMGFRDSFITAVLNGKPVSIERASLLENDWGQKSLVRNGSSQKSGETAVPTLVFRVEISRSDKPAGTEVTENYKKLAGNRGFEILSTDGGALVYLIGKFITFESASDYAGLLNRNGYREAKVVAYLGSTEIPVETARQLFERQK
jgi:tetratricopeptide (TPR) repeat protein